MAEATIHQGRNVKRFRELAGMKQEALAIALGDDWNQQKISLLEQRELIDNAILEDVAKVLNIPADAIRNLTEQSAISIVATTFNSHDNSFAHQCTFNINPVEKWIDALEKNDKLHEENKALYERLLEVERGKIELLEKLLSLKS